MSTATARLKMPPHYSHEAKALCKGSVEEGYVHVIRPGRVQCNHCGHISSRPPVEPLEAPAVIASASLDLTSLAHSVTLAASIPDNPTAQGILAAWETLTGLPRTEAVAAAQEVSTFPAPIRATVVPF